MLAKLIAAAIAAMMYFSIMFTVSAGTNLVGRPTTGSDIGSSDFRLAQAGPTIKPQLQISEGADTGADKTSRDRSAGPTPTGQQSMARQTWELISATTDRSILERFIIKFPGSIQAVQAQQRLDQIERGISSPEPVINENVVTPSTATAPPDEVQEITPPPVVVQDKTPPPEIDGENLVVAVQKELQRVGCNPGRADGKWGKKSTGAAVRYNKSSGLKLQTDLPGLALLASLQTRSQRVCPLICNKRQELVGGVCRTKLCPAGQKLSSAGRCFKPVVAKTCKPGQKLSSRGQCYVPRTKNTTKATTNTAQSNRPQCSWCENKRGIQQILCEPALEKARSSGNCE